MKRDFLTANESCPQGTSVAPAKMRERSFQHPHWERSADHIDSATFLNVHQMIGSWVSDGSMISTVLISRSAEEQGRCYAIKCSGFDWRASRRVHACSNRLISPLPEQPCVRVESIHLCRPPLDDWEALPLRRGVPE